MCVVFDRGHKQEGHIPKTRQLYRKCSITTRISKTEQVWENDIKHGSVISAMLCQGADAGAVQAQLGKAVKARFHELVFWHSIVPACNSPSNHPLIQIFRSKSNIVHPSGKSTGLYGICWYFSSNPSVVPAILPRLSALASGRFFSMVASGAYTPVNIHSGAIRLYL